MIVFLVLARGKIHLLPQHWIVICVAYLMLEGLLLALTTWARLLDLLYGMCVRMYVGTVWAQNHAKTSYQLDTRNPCPSGGGRGGGIGQHTVDTYARGIITKSKI
jgi:hypothetical protein